jgi:hypothetical protein
LSSVHERKGRHVEYLIFGAILAVFAASALSKKSGEKPLLTSFTVAVTAPRMTVITSTTGLVQTLFDNPDGTQGQKAEQWNVAKLADGTTHLTSDSSPATTIAIFANGNGLMTFSDGSPSIPGTSLDAAVSGVDIVGEDFGGAADYWSMVKHVCETGRWPDGKLASIAQRAQACALYRQWEQITTHVAANAPHFSVSGVDIVGRGGGGFHGGGHGGGFHGGFHGGGFRGRGGFGGWAYPYPVAVEPYCDPYGYSNGYPCDSGYFTRPW